MQHGLLTDLKNRVPSIQFVIMPWRGEIQMHITWSSTSFPISFCPVIDQISSVLFWTGSVFIWSSWEMCQFRSRISHPLTKSIVCKLFATGWNWMQCFASFWTGLRAKNHTEGCLWHIRNHPGTAMNLIQQKTSIQNHVRLNFPLQEITTNWIDELLGEGAL